MVKIPTKKEAKGITLIALVISIIVLLILAGVTINALTGSDSAPAKANEAAQKNDIGAAKDDVQLTAINAQTKGYEGAYVGTNISAGSSKEYVGKTVVKELYQKYGAGKTIGKATVTVEVTGSADASNFEAITGGNITIFTTDFELIGEVELSGGVITWGEIESNEPGVKGLVESLTLNPGGSTEVGVTLKGVSGPVTWNSSDPDVAYVEEIEGNTQKTRVKITATSSATNNSQTTITATAGGLSATCTVTVEILPVTSVEFLSKPTEIGKSESIDLEISLKNKNGNPATANSIAFEVTQGGSTSTLVSIGLKTGETNIATLTAGTTTGTGITVKVIVDGNSNINDSFEIAVVTPVPVPTSWVKTTYGTANTGNEWYNYGGKTVNPPKISGTKMIPVKYNGTVPTADNYNTTNNWANAITADEKGSMFVWIPRYAYKIPSANVHTPNAATIDIIFVGTNNQDLAGQVSSSDITADPTVDGAGTTKYLVHPAFTANATNGGGFGELTGIWFAKFESTGSSSSLSVEPAHASLTNMTIGAQFTLAKGTTFGESGTSVLKAHMVKNSEWGAVAYLAQSTYGANAKIQNNNVYYAGGINNSSNVSQVYTNNYTQSTTYNATGVYDMNGGAWEYVASYVNYANNSYLNSYTALTEDGSTDKATSNAYKTAYTASGTSQQNSYNLLNPANTDKTTVKKGDAIYETSDSYSSSSGSWYSASAHFPASSYPFFVRSGSAGYSDAGSFYFVSSNGGSSSNIRFPCGSVPLALYNVT